MHRNRPVRVEPAVLVGVLLGVGLGACDEQPGKDCVVADQRYADGEHYTAGCHTAYCDNGIVWITEEYCTWFIARNPKCLGLCPLETVPMLVAEQVECEITRAEDVDGVLQESRIPPCEGDGVPRVPEGFNECFTLRLEAGAATPSPHDDLSPECIDAGEAFELQIETRAPIRWYGELLASCMLIDRELGAVYPTRACD